MTVHNITSHNRESQKPTQAVIYINPPMARRILEKNTHNRPLSEMHVARLYDEMTAGRWQYNGEAIKWSADDVLLDGQHRLMALSRIQDDAFQIPFLVIRGLPTATQDTMDQGKTRTAADQLVLDGLTNKDGRIIAGAIRVYLQWSSGHLFVDRYANKVSNPHVLEWATQHPMEMAMMQDICCEQMRRVKCRPSVTLAVLLHFFLLDGEAARDFTAGLYTGAGLGAGSPILTLRERLDRIRTQGVRVSDRDYIAFFVLAWNAWREGRKMSKFQRPVGGSWARDNFPVAV